jgi:hypothetical protein
VENAFDFWIAGVDDRSAEVTSALESANATIVPTERLTGVDAAYWCRLRQRSHLRWALPYDEDPLLDAHGQAGGGPRAHDRRRHQVRRGVRAHGLLVPVWDLPVEATAADVEAPAAALRDRLRS